MQPPERLTERLFAFVQQAAAMLAQHPFASRIPNEKLERPTLRRGEDGYFGFTIALEPDWGLALAGKNWDRLGSLAMNNCCRRC